VLAGSMLVTPGGALFAQESGVLTLTLDEALALASGSNPALRQATNNTMLNAVEMRTAWLDQLLPSVGLTLFSSTFNGNLQRQATDNFGNPIANPAADWNYFSRTTHNVSVNWAFQGASLFRDHKRQTFTNLDRDIGQIRALTEVENQVQRLYLDALEQRELMLAEEALIEAREIDLDVAERLFSLALRTRVDLLNAELEIEQQRLVHRQQQTAYQRALLALRTAIGLTEERTVEITDEDLPIFDPVDFEADDLVSRAMEVNPVLRQSDLAVTRAELELSSQKDGWWPRLDMGFQIYRQAFASAGEALFDPSLNQQFESQFYLAFSLPILNDYFAQDRDRERARVEVMNQRESDRESRLELEAEIRGALLDLENEWESYRLSERSSVIAEEALRLAREEYRLGTRSFEDLRTSFQNEADTQRQIITARHSFVEALLVLEAAVGTSIREMIPPANEAQGS
jgi:outer membrane protein TolC